MSDTGKSWELTEKERARLAKVRADLKAGLNPYRDVKGIGLELEKPVPIIKAKSARQERKERLAKWNNLGKNSPSHVKRTVHTLIGPPPKVKPKPLDPLCCIVCESKVELTTSIWGKLLTSLTRTSNIEIVNYLTPDGKVLPVPYKINSARPSTVTGRVCHRKKCQAKVEILDDPAFKSPRAMLHEPVRDERPGHRSGFTSRMQRKCGV